MRRSLGWLLVLGLASGCGPSANVEQERETLLKLDRDWSASVADTDKFASFMAPDASFYPPGMPVITGAGPIKEAMTQMASAPGFSLEFTPTRAVVSSAGDIGYTTGTYRSSMGGVTEVGKYVTVWKKQPDGQWKVTEDIFNADSSGAPPVAHVMVAPSGLTWGDPPPALPAGAKLAVVSGDPSKPGPFVLRLQFPAGYKISPHWHPTDENATLLAGSLALGMGDTFDEAKMQPVTAGSFVVLPAETRHYLHVKAASTIQLHGMGPFVLNYVNAADDPRTMKK